PDDLLGRKVRCPSCQDTFTAVEEVAELPAAPLVAEEEVPGQDPRAPARGHEQEFEEAPLSPRQRRPVPRDEDYPKQERAVADEWREGRPALTNEYSIDFGKWFEYAKAHYGAVLVPMVGYALL